MNHTAGASLVHWNRFQLPVYLRYAHDSDVRIWDMKVHTGTCTNSIQLYESFFLDLFSCHRTSETLHCVSVYICTLEQDPWHRLELSQWDLLWQPSTSHDAARSSSGCYGQVVQSPREPVNTIKTGTHPVWRAKNYVSQVCAYLGTIRLLFFSH